MTPCGSPCYAPPEMLSKKSYNPMKGDIWSCGIVLYTMLCGFLPFEHESTVELYRMVERGVYDEPKHLSPMARDLIKRMLRADPEKRLSLADVLNNKIFMYLYMKVASNNEVIGHAQIN